MPILFTAVKSITCAVTALPLDAVIEPVELTVTAPAVPLSEVIVPRVISPLLVLSVTLPPVAVTLLAVNAPLLLMLIRPLAVDTFVSSTAPLLLM